DVMRRPPRPPKEPLLTRRLALWSVFEGGVAFSAIAAVYLVMIAQGLPEETVRAMTFVAIVAVVFALILANRTYSASLLRAFFSPNRALAAVSVFVVAVLSAIFAFEYGRELFGFGALSIMQTSIAASAGASALFALEALKFIFARRKRAAA
ncbi:MAG TPA: cation transporting ATPase C-terminal domain-containing protein, partial [Parvularculaceae bacterium]|nr:cation transporting ATPase C-terminal domain-containing protein [Parvularculaceae bacterium]